MQFLLDFNEKIENLSRYWKVHEDKDQPLPQIILDKVIEYIDVNANQKANQNEKNDTDSIHILFGCINDINDYSKSFKNRQESGCLNKRLFQSQFHAINEVILNDFEIKAALKLIKWANNMLLNSSPFKENSKFEFINNFDIDSLSLKSQVNSLSISQSQSQSKEEKERQRKIELSANSYKEYLNSIYNFLKVGSKLNAELYSKECGLFNIVNVLNLLNPFHDRDFCDDSNFSENINLEELPIFCKTSRYTKDSTSFGNVNWLESLIIMRELSFNENLDVSLRKIYSLLSGALNCQNIENIYEIFLVKLNNFVVDSILSKYLKLNIEVFKYNDCKDKFKKFEESLNKTPLEFFLKSFIEENHRAINYQSNIMISFKLIYFNFKKLRNTNNTLFRNETVITNSNLNINLKNEEKSELFIKEYNNILLLINQILITEQKRILGNTLKSNLDNSEINKSQDIESMSLSDNLDKFEYLFQKMIFLFETTILCYNIFSEDGFYLVNNTDLKKDQKKKYELLKVNHDKIILSFVEFMIIYYVKSIENSKSYVDKDIFDFIPALGFCLTEECIKIGLKIIHNHIQHNQYESFNRIIRNIFPNICEIILYELVQKDIDCNEKYDMKQNCSFEESLNGLEKEINISVYTNMINLQNHEDRQFTHSMMYLLLKICSLLLSRNQFSACAKLLYFYEENLIEILDKTYKTNSFNINDNFLIKSEFKLEITNEYLIVFYLYFIKRILNCFLVLKNLHCIKNTTIKFDKLESIQTFFRLYHFLLSNNSIKDSLNRVDILFNEIQFTLKDLAFFSFKISTNHLITFKDKIKLTGKTLSETFFNIFFIFEGFDSYVVDIISDNKIGSKISKTELRDYTKNFLLNSNFNVINSMNKMFFSFCMEILENDDEIISFSFLKDDKYNILKDEIEEETYDDI